MRVSKSEQLREVTQEEREKEKLYLLRELDRKYNVPEGTFAQATARAQTKPAAISAGKWPKALYPEKAAAEAVIALYAHRKNNYIAKAAEWDERIGMIEDTLKG